MRAEQSEAGDAYPSRALSSPLRGMRNYGGTGWIPIFRALTPPLRFLDGIHPYRLAGFARIRDRFARSARAAVPDGHDAVRDVHDQAVAAMRRGLSAPRIVRPDNQLGDMVFVRPALREAVDTARARPIRSPSFPPGYTFRYHR